ncbi:hypothetical protein T458_20215 [Brevibacillus panacihumi W25]|uniref:DUF4083 domain-containing protein n=2 Tax=Brevibacillus panacihumi TaxID=497735 RepID=V6M5N2_9BACL|nr:hypothetical protein [Brevibacillus panacihumi]EST53190.1 hypothetical protein T458_20215 [Brevibacillus panacihumi W25]
MDLGFAFASFIPLLLMLAFYALIIYLIVQVIRFMKQKTLHDQQRNEKLDALIQLLREKEREQQP